MRLYPDALPARINPNGCGRNMSLFLVMRKYDCNLRQLLERRKYKDDVGNWKSSLILLTQLLEGKKRLTVKALVNYRVFQASHIWFGMTFHIGIWNRTTYWLTARMIRFQSWSFPTSDVVWTVWDFLSCLGKRIEAETQLWWLPKWRGPCQGCFRPLDTTNLTSGQLGRWPTRFSVARIPFTPRPLVLERSEVPAICHRCRTEFRWSFAIWSKKCLIRIPGRESRAKWQPTSVSYCSGCPKFGWGNVFLPIKKFFNGFWRWPPKFCTNRDFQMKKAFNTNTTLLALSCPVLTSETWSLASIGFTTIVEKFMQLKSYTTKKIYIYFESIEWSVYGFFPETSCSNQSQLSFVNCRVTFERVFFANCTDASTASQMWQKCTLFFYQSCHFFVDWKKGLLSVWVKKTNKE